MRDIYVCPRAAKNGKKYENLPVREEKFRAGCFETTSRSPYPAVLRTQEKSTATEEKIGFLTPSSRLTAYSGPQSHSSRDHGVTMVRWSTAWCHAGRASRTRQFSGRLQVSGFSMGRVPRCARVGCWLGSSRACRPGNHCVAYRDLLGRAASNCLRTPRQVAVRPRRRERRRARRQNRAKSRKTKIVNQ